jgi:integral membrane sensor domain MASE1
VYSVSLKKYKPATIGILAVVYFVAGKLGLTLAFVHSSASAVWPPAGIALAALLILGYEVWPGTLLGAFLVNVTTAGSVATSIGIATGNTLEALPGAWLMTKLAGGRNAFDREQDTLKFAIFAGMLSTTVSATCGVTTLCLGGFAKWTNFGAVWSTWWWGDAAGDMIAAPLLILWSAVPWLRWNRSQFLEALGLLACLIVVGRVVFAGFLLSGTSNYPIGVPLHSSSNLGFIPIWPAGSSHRNGRTLPNGNLGHSAWARSLREANGERVSSPVAGFHGRYGSDDSEPCGGVCGASARGGTGSKSLCERPADRGQLPQASG